MRESCSRNNLFKLDRRYSIHVHFVVKLVVSFQVIGDGGDVFEVIGSFLLEYALNHETYLLFEPFGCKGYLVVRTSEISSETSHQSRFPGGVRESYVRLKSAS